MSYELTQTPRFAKALRKLDRPIARRVLVSLYELAELAEPTDRLKPLHHELAGLWRLRVGEYRIIVDVHKNELAIIALDLGHRSEVYD